MNILLWILQGLAALLYGASGVMKVFVFEKVSADVPSFGALPRQAWMALGIVKRDGAASCEPAVRGDTIGVWQHVSTTSYPSALAPWLWT